MERAGFQVYVKRAANPPNATMLGPSSRIRIANFGEETFDGPTVKKTLETGEEAASSTTRSARGAACWWVYFYLFPSNPG